MRPDTDGPCPGGPVPYKFYHQTYSTDLGKSWSAPRPIPNVGCVRPKLLLTATGTLLLSGGRLCQDLVKYSCPGGGDGSGILLWENADGMADLDGGRNGTEWVPYCTTAEHNRGWQGDPALRFNSSTPAQAYTSIFELGPSAAGISYQHGSGYRPETTTFVMRIDVTARPPPPPPLPLPPAPTQKPLVLWCSTPVRPNETVMLQGAFWGPSPQVRFTALSDPQGEPELVAPLTVTDSTIMAVVPASFLSDAYRISVVGSTKPTQATGVAGAPLPAAGVPVESGPIIANQPDLWWAQGDGGKFGTPCDWIRVFGRA